MSHTSRVIERLMSGEGTPSDIAFAGGPEEAAKMVDAEWADATGHSEPSTDESVPPTCDQCDAPMAPDSVSDTLCNWCVSESLGLPQRAAWFAADDEQI